MMATHQIYSGEPGKVSSVFQFDWINIHPAHIVLTQYKQLGDTCLKFH